MKKRLISAASLTVLCCVTLVTPAQSRPYKTNTRDAPPAQPVAATPTTAPTPPLADPGIKRNTRPSESTVDTHPPDAAVPAAAAVYEYQFDRPGFLYGHVEIEHDNAGKGKISFVKEGYGGTITDPVALSAGTMDKLRHTFDALDFINSNENYQHEKDFSNMGNVSISLKRDGRTRTAKYNWTDNKLAKELMDEYRKVSNEYTWRFEMTLGRENQPLSTPGLMETMDRYITRGEISDPPHLLPLLEQLSTDVRLPLMARNRAAKIVKQIQMTK